MNLAKDWNDIAIVQTELGKSVLKQNKHTMEVRMYAMDWV